MKEQRTSGGRRRIANGTTLARWGLVVLLAAGILWGIANRDVFEPSRLAALVDGLGGWAPVAFIGLYAAASLLFLPGSVLTLAGGALFGPWWGTLYTLAGATLGATLSFLVARYAAGDWVSRRAGGRLKTLVKGVEGQGWRFVALVRLVPLFPFNLLNYALGLTRIRLLHYVLASAVCMIPGAFAYTYLGFAGRQAASEGGGAIKTIAVAVMLLAAVALIPMVVKRWRAQQAASLAAETAEESVLAEDARVGLQKQET